MQLKYFCFQFLCFKCYKSGFYAVSVCLSGIIFISCPPSHCGLIFSPLWARRPDDQFKSALINHASMWHQFSGVESRLPCHPSVAQHPQRLYKVPLRNERLQSHEASLCGAPWSWIEQLNPCGIGSMANKFSWVCPVVLVQAFDVRSTRCGLVWIHPQIFLPRQLLGINSNLCTRRLAAVVICPHMHTHTFILINVRSEMHTPLTSTLLVRRQAGFLFFLLQASSFWKTSHARAVFHLILFITARAAHSQSRNSIPTVSSQKQFLPEPARRTLYGLIYSRENTTRCDVHSWVHLLVWKVNPRQCNWKENSISWDR